MRQTSDSPTRKTFAGLIAGASTTVLVWALRQWAHVEVPAEIALALCTLITLAASYLTPPSEKDTVGQEMIIPSPLIPDKDKP